MTGPGSRNGEATLGITWYAQDSLGELVHYEPPQEDFRIEKDRTYGEVESVKAVSDLISPLSGRVIEVNQKVVDAPETVNDDPYGDGWLVRIELTDPGEADELLDAEALPEPGRRAVTPTHLVGYLSLTDSDRREMLDTIGVESIDDALRRHPRGVRFGRTPRRAAGALRAGAGRTPERARGEERPHGG